MMRPEGSITRSIRLLQQGDAEGARVIWQRYFPRLVRIAREKLGRTPRHIGDEEDVALSALDRFCRAAQAGHFPDLADRDELWRLLLRITTRRALDFNRQERRLAAEDRPVEPPGARAGAKGCELELDEVRDDGPTPEFAAVMAEQCRVLLARLVKPELQEIAIAKMEGYGNQEIAEKLQCSIRAVERRLRLIRDVWGGEQ